MLDTRISPRETGSIFWTTAVRLAWKNGSLGTVEKIERFTMQSHHRMTVKLDTGKTVQFSTADYKNFDHGYAATIHKSQGATANRAHILASPYMDRHGAYVAMSRHTDRADMFYSEQQFANYDDLIYKLSRNRRKDTTLDYLKRFEEKGRPEKLRDLLQAVRVVSIEDIRKRAADRLLEILKIRKEPNTAGLDDRRMAKEGAKKLRELLGRHKKDKRGKTYGRSI